MGPSGWTASGVAAVFLVALGCMGQTSPPGEMHGGAPGSGGVGGGPPSGGGDGGRGGAAAGAGTGGMVTIPEGGGGMGSGGNGGSVLPQPACKPGNLVVGAAPLRPLTRAEYRATVKDLLGVTLKAETPPSGSSGFDNDLSDLSVSSVVIEQQLADAETIAKTALADPTKLVPCSITAPDDACVKTFIANVGQRAFRRPLASDEIDSLFASYAAGKAGADARTGLEVTLQHILLAPAFLYRVELGRAAPAGKARPLTSWEMASRLSYFLWGTMPDQALFAAASEDRLATSDQVAAQVKRMLRDPAGKPVPAAQAVVTSFHAQWLGLRDIGSLAKDAGRYPAFAAAQSSIRQETERFTDEIFWGGGGVSELLGARYSFLNDKLAPIYKVTGVTGPDLRRVDLDPKQRAGILTQASVLALTAGDKDPSPIKRGKYIRERILCTDIPAPMIANVLDLLPAANAAKNERERYTMHSANPECAGCHKLLDGVGFPLFSYDAIGGYRSEWSKGVPIDASGELTATDVDGPVKSAVDMADRLSKSQAVQSCVVRHWFRYMAGRDDDDADACTIDRATAQVAARGGKLEEIILALTSSDTFLNLPPAAP